MNDIICRFDKITCQHCLNCCKGGQMKSDCIFNKNELKYSFRLLTCWYNVERTTQQASECCCYKAMKAHQFQLAYISQAGDRETHSHLVGRCGRWAFANRIHKCLMGDQWTKILVGDRAIAALDGGQLSGCENCVSLTCQTWWNRKQCTVGTWYIHTSRWTGCVLSYLDGSRELGS